MRLLVTNNSLDFVVDWISFGHFYQLLTAHNKVLDVTQMLSSE